MAVTRDEVVRLATQLFGGEQSAKALSVVDEYGTESHEREVERVKLAILEVSDGKLTRLPYFVKCAKIDYRDVLVSAKLPKMSDEEEARWQASADRLLALWNKNA